MLSARTSKTEPATRILVSNALNCSSELSDVPHAQRCEVLSARVLGDHPPIVLRARCSSRAGRCQPALVGQSVEPPRAPDLAPERERSPELEPDLSPRLRAPARVQHHAQDAVDAEPGVPEAGVGHFVPAALRVKRATRSRSSAINRCIATVASTFLPACLKYRA